MRTRMLGRLWPVSALTLGGGGLGQVWGPTTRQEAVATVREAVEQGITLLDLAPGYGGGEGERVIGEAFGGRLPDGVRITTKYRVSNPPAGEVSGRLESSLRESLDRMRLSSADVLFLHGYLVATAAQGGERRTPAALFRDAVRPALERLVEQGLIGAWGITAIGVPRVVLKVLTEDPPPAAIQAITNPIDSPGELKWFEQEARPREIIRVARQCGSGVMGIRVAGAGALTDAVDRELPAHSPIMADFRRAAPLRQLASELGESTASLAHRYALSMPGVDTIVLGVKNRAELRECVQAEARGTLPPETIEHIDLSMSRRTRRARAGG